MNIVELYNIIQDMILNENHNKGFEDRVHTMEHLFENMSLQIQSDPNLYHFCDLAVKIKNKITRLEDKHRIYTTIDEYKEILKNDKVIAECFQKNKTSKFYLNNIDFETLIDCLEKNINLYKQALAKTAKNDLKYNFLFRNFQKNLNKLNDAKMIREDYIERTIEHLNKNFENYFHLKIQQFNTATIRRFFPETNNIYTNKYYFSLLSRDNVFEALAKNLLDEYLMNLIAQELLTQFYSSFNTKNTFQPNTASSQNNRPNPSQQHSQSRPQSTSQTNSSSRPNPSQQNTQSRPQSTSQTNSSSRPNPSQQNTQSRPQSTSQTNSSSSPNPSQQNTKTEKPTTNASQNTSSLPTRTYSNEYLQCCAVLGVEKNASIAEVRKAYKKLALKLHPDKNKGDDSQFKKMKDCYNLIMNQIEFWNNHGFSKQ